VIDRSGKKLSAADFGTKARPCLVCGNDACICAHETSELTAAVERILLRFEREHLAETISASALKAIIGEAAITPKPGLVDMANTGSHTDMDFFSFLDSAAAILPYFRECALAGFDSSLSPEDLFESLRKPGKIAERAMLKATGGVNTHRGIIFSLGILSAAWGRLYREKEPSPEEALELSAKMTARLSADFYLPPASYAAASHAAASHGEAIHARWGIKGIRGEVSGGFPSVRRVFPLFRRMLAEPEPDISGHSPLAGRSLNNAGVAALLNLIVCVEDTNIIHRGGTGVFESVRQELRAFLSTGPSLGEMLEKAGELDREFIARHISPGGSADLLAVILFLHYLELKSTTEPKGNRNYVRCHSAGRRRG
jgi:holo-ACP synthase/triphosphoribosyl-dephospho-CoA synthase